VCSYYWIIILLFPLLPWKPPMNLEGGSRFYEKICSYKRNFNLYIDFGFNIDGYELIPPFYKSLLNWTWNWLDVWSFEMFRFERDFQKKGEERNMNSESSAHTTTVHKFS